MQIYEFKSTLTLSLHNFICIFQFIITVNPVLNSLSFPLQVLNLAGDVARLLVCPLFQPLLDVGLADGTFKLKESSKVLRNDKDLVLGFPCLLLALVCFSFLVSCFLQLPGLCLLSSRGNCFFEYIYSMYWITDNNQSINQSYLRSIGFMLSPRICWCCGC